ncbi:hypothetical protein AB0K40_16200 [Nonomuraea bangladeshensis]|uniref:JAB domain-containing protein n=1 Tax=Nonomuraea bangladeshensis TaxID=404385 RepID=A0ABV3H3E3_9ACTN
MTDHYHIRIYESELETICDETFEHQDIETGGSLYGLFSHGGSATVFLATRPAGEVVRRETALELDPEVARVMESGVWTTFGLQSLGMWHSHHWIGLFEPSSGDLSRARGLAAKAQRLRHVEILANFVHGDGAAPQQRSRRPWRREPSGDAVVRLTPFFYPDVARSERAEASFAVIPGESPIRKEAARLELPSGVGAALLREAGSQARSRYQLGTSTARPGSGPADGRDDPPVRPALEEPRTPAPPGPDVAVRPDAAGAVPPDVAGDPRLEPIPDPAAFLEKYLNPLLHRSGHMAELRPMGDQLICVVVRGHRHRANFRYTLAWDGRYPFVWAASIQADRQSLDWVPRAPEERYLLPKVFLWGIQNLQGQ